MHVDISININIPIKYINTYNNMINLYNLYIYIYIYIYTEIHI